MKLSIALVLGLFGAAPPAGAQMAAPFASFEAQLADIHRLAVPEVDELIRILRDSRDVKEQRDAIERMVSRAGAFDMSEQHRVVFALTDAARSPMNGMEVRGKALDALGRCAAWFTDATAVKEAVETLCDIAISDSPSDVSTDLRFYALFGLSKVSGKLPSYDQNLQEKVARTALGFMDRSTQRRDRFLALMTLNNQLSHQGAGVLYRSYDLMGRFQRDILNPLETNLNAFYGDRDNDTDIRYLTMRCLRAVAATYGSDHTYQMRHRIKQVFQNMSNQEPDGTLRQFARMCAQYMRD